MHALSALRNLQKPSKDPHQVGRKRILAHWAKAPPHWSIKGIYDLYTAVDEICHISSCHRQPMIPRTCCDHGVLNPYGKTRFTNLTQELPPNKGYVQCPIQTKHPTTQAHKPQLQVGASLTLRHFSDAVPDLTHHNCIGDALLDICLEPVDGFLNALRLCRFAKQVGIHKVLHQKEMSLRSATVSF